MVHEDIAEEDESSEATPPIPQVETEEPKPTADERFKLLRDFHHNQIRSQNAGDRFSGLGSDPGSAYSSPSALNRIMSLYTSFSSPSSAKQRILPPREARPEEGLLHLTSPSTELCRIAKLREGGYSGTSSASQRQLQLPRLPGSEPQLVKELLPVPYLLRTKRTKRCKTCKHIVVRPEAKVSTARFRMKMVAASYIPSLSLRPLPSTGVNSLASSQQLALPSFSGTIGQGQRAVGEGGEGVLLPHRTAQFLLTVKNPLFERVRITLATPPTVPGRHAHRVTLLCPGFEVGAAGEGLQDVWADALADPSTKSRSRESTGARGRESLSGSGSGDATGMAEAGKVYERGRNSVGVVIEIVPAPLREPNYPASEDVFLDAKSQAGRSEAGRSEARSFSSALGHFESTGVEGDFHGDASDEDDDAIKEDEDILEIPVRVRVEWEADALDDVTAGVAEKKEVAGDGERVRRELSYWVVLGVGRVARDM